MDRHHGAAMARCRGPLPRFGRAGKHINIMSSSASARTLTDNAADTVRGIMLAAVSYLILTLGDTAAKWAILASGVAWAMLWRGVFGAIAVASVTSGVSGRIERSGTLPVLARLWARAGIGAGTV